MQHHSAPVSAFSNQIYPHSQQPIGSGKPNPKSAPQTMFNPLMNSSAFPMQQQQPQQQQPSIQQVKQFYMTQPARPTNSFTNQNLALNSHFYPTFSEQLQNRGHPDNMSFFNNNVPQQQALNDNRNAMLSQNSQLFQHSSEPNSFFAPNHHHPQQQQQQQITTNISRNNYVTDATMQHLFPPNYLQMEKNQFGQVNGSSRDGSPTVQQTDIGSPDSSYYVRRNVSSPVQVTEFSTLVADYPRKFTNLSPNHNGNVFPSSCQNVVTQSNGVFTNSSSASSQSPIPSTTSPFSSDSQLSGHHRSSTFSANVNDGLSNVFSPNDVLGSPWFAPDAGNNPFSSDFAAKNTKRTSLDDEFGFESRQRLSSAENPNIFGQNTLFSDVKGLGNFSQASSASGSLQLFSSAKSNSARDGSTSIFNIPKSSAYPLTKEQALAAALGRPSHSINAFESSNKYEQSCAEEQKRAMLYNQATVGSFYGGGNDGIGASGAVNGGVSNSCAFNVGDRMKNGHAGVLSNAASANGHAARLVQGHGERLLAQMPEEERDFFAKQTPAKAEKQPKMSYAAIAANPNPKVKKQSEMQKGKSVWGNDLPNAIRHMTLKDKDGDGSPMLDRKGDTTWAGVAADSAAMQASHGSAKTEYSRKVFIGGLPPDITEKELIKTFSTFGTVVVFWPGKPGVGQDGTPVTVKPDDSEEVCAAAAAAAAAAASGEGSNLCPPKGFAFLLFAQTKAVDGLLKECDTDANNRHKVFYHVSSSTMKDKATEIRPWNLAHTEFYPTSNRKADLKLSAFVGGLPRTIRAQELCAMICEKFGPGVVAYTSIDIDPEFHYPKGVGRVTFSSKKAFTRAIECGTVELRDPHVLARKSVEIKPWILEDQNCEVCNGTRNQGRFAPFFCLQEAAYFCRRCWDMKHSSYTGKHTHQAIVKGARLVEVNSVDGTISPASFNNTSNKNSK